MNHKRRGESVIFPEMDLSRIITAEGDNIYFHRNSILNADFKALKVSMKVSLVYEQEDEGPQASRVMILGLK